MGAMASPWHSSQDGHWLASQTPVVLSGKNWRVSISCTFSEAQVKYTQFAVAEKQGMLGPDLSRKTFQKKAQHRRLKRPCDGLSSLSH